MNVPKLRFKEYSRGSTSAWIKAHLKEFIDDYKGGASLRPSDFLPSGKFEVIPKKAISSGGKLNLDKSSPTYCTETFFSNNQRSVIDRNYLVTTLRDLVPSGPSIGYIVKIEDDRKYLLAQGVYGIKIKDELDEGFLIQFSNTIKYRELMQTMMVGSTQVHIRNGDFFKLLLNIPSLDEQQKIALFLSRIDQKISALTKKYELLIQYRKGVMQKIFNQEIRFNDKCGRPFPEWLKTSLGEVGDIRSGAGFPDVEQGGVGGTPFYKVSDMNLPSNEVEMTVANNYVSDEQIKRLKLKVIDGSAVIFAKVGAAIFLERKRKASNFLIDNNMMAFIPKFDINFAKCLFETIHLSKFAQVGALPSYNSSDISIIPVAIPTSEDEQFKISNFLMRLNKKVEICNGELELTKQFKRGLLQQMFI
jgi:type I restriction enzyme S subunit